MEINAYLVWGEDLSGSMQGAGGVGGLLMRAEATDATYYHYDANGNPARLLNANMAKGGVYRYDAFGNVRRRDGVLTPGNPWEFSTKYRDKETGFSYYGYRFYDPKTGRWPSRDPIGERGGVNLYGFVGNNGVNRWDFLGLLNPGPSPSPTQTFGKVCIRIGGAGSRGLAAGGAAAASDGPLPIGELVGAGIASFTICFEIGTIIAEQVYPDPLPYPPIPRPTPRPKTDPDTDPDTEPTPRPQPRRPALCRFTRFGELTNNHGHGGGCYCQYNCNDYTYVKIPAQKREDCPYANPPHLVGKPLLMGHDGSWD